jgi:hypothetical protein
LCAYPALADEEMAKATFAWSESKFLNAAPAEAE